MSTENEQHPTKNPNPVLNVAKDGIVLFSNKAGETLLKEWRTTVGEKLPTYITDVMQRVLSKHKPEKIKLIVGKQVYLTSFYHFPEEECINIYGFDISDQEGFEDKLRASEEKYHNIVETANEGIIVTDIKEAESNLKETFDNLENLVKERTAELEKAYNLLKENEQLLSESQRIAHIGSWEWNIADNKETWSDEVYRIFGLDRDEFELTHRVFLNFIHHEDIEYVNNAINEALNGKPYDIDYRINIADGQVRVINSQGGVLFDGKNNPILMRGIIQDITERKKAEERVRNLANIVESSNDPSLLNLSTA